MRRLHPNLPLLIGLGASVLVHGMGAIALPGLAATSSRASGATALDPPEPREPNDDSPLAETPEELRLGIKKSAATTITWIGYEEYQEHLAPEASIDQAAMALAPYSPSLEFDQPIEPSAQSPAPDHAAAPSALSPVASTLSNAPVTEATPDHAALEPHPIDAEPLSASAPASLESPADLPDSDHRSESDLIGPVPQTPEPGTDSGAASAQDSSDALAQDGPVAPPAQPAPPASASSGLPGDIADKESQAFSKQRTHRVELGKPLAAEGLQITTIRPRWSHFTRLTAWPRDPLVEVRFGRSGRVRYARLLESSGSPDVDRPLMDAVYNWAARGEALEALPPEPVEEDGATVGAAPGAAESAGERAPPADTAATIRLIIRVGLRG